MLVTIPFRAFTGKASLKIEVPDSTESRFRIRAAVEIAWNTRKTNADLGGAYLRGANLRGAYLREADLRGAYLRNADLGGANLREADLRGADLRGADLRGADLRGADLRGADLGNIPIVESLDRVMLEAVTAKPKLFDMSAWHTETACGTAHCRAGWAVTLAGEAGQALEAKVGTAVAGILIYQASTPDAPIPDFYCDNDTALADIKARAEAASK